MHSCTWIITLCQIVAIPYTCVMTHLLHITSCWNQHITLCSIQGCLIGSTNPHGGIIVKYLWLALLRHLPQAHHLPEALLPHTWLPVNGGDVTHSIFLRHSHRLRHGAAAMVRLTTWRRKTVCIKMAPVRYHPKVPRHTRAGRSLNLHAHVHTCTPSSHTFIRLRKTLQHGAEKTYASVTQNGHSTLPSYYVILTTPAGRSLNLQAHVHTCTPSSHTFILWLNSHHLTSTKGPNSHHLILHIRGTGCGSACR